MNARAPHYVLYSECTSTPERPACGGTSEQIESATDSAGRSESACWHFVLRSSEGECYLDVSDIENHASPERLELIAVVRGLEALDQPSQVTLITASRSIRRGLRFGLEMWRDSQWQWERFGKMTPIKNSDLWQRVDRALNFHQIECRATQVEAPVDDLSQPVPKSLFEPRSPKKTAANESRQLRVDAGEPSTRRTGPHWSANLWGRLTRRLFGWCGLWRSDPSLVIVAH